MKIILDNKEVSKLVPESLPMLIHGAEGSGASMYTIALAAKWFAQGKPILFLCGYSKAEEEFSKLAGKHKSAVFYTFEKVDQFKKDIKNTDSLVIVKNIELFDIEVVNSIRAKSVIISGDLNGVTFKDALLKIPFASEVYFSPMEGEDLPVLKKYEGWVISGEFSGITKLEQ